MKTIILDLNKAETILIHNVNTYRPIFAVNSSGDLYGMIVKEHEGWILRTGRDCGANGFHPTLERCIESCMKTLSLTFVVDININTNKGD